MTRKEDRDPPSIGIVMERGQAQIYRSDLSDEVPREEVLAAGFEPVPEEMSDDEVRKRYGVKEIYQVTDDRRKAVN